MPGDTKNCESCGGREENPNPLDQCGRESLGCDNPCGHSPHNTPRCESLPSQIQNFTDQFFGTVVKTEVNGKVVWSLPCQLDVGLPGNPRGVDEGLACYFLRLFRDGIGGLKGDPGATGPAGENGTNAYAVVKQSFPQPTIGNPLIQFVIFPNPAIAAGLGLYIVGSGYYTVTDVQPGGVVFATFASPAGNPPATVPAGTLVIPSGLPGAPGIQGPTGATGVAGPPGATGAQGPVGNAVTVNNGFAYPPGGSAQYDLITSYDEVNFGGTYLNFAAPATGRYLVTATIPITTTILTNGTPLLVTAWFKLRNTTAASDIPGSETFTGFVFTSTPQVQEGNVVVNAVCQIGLGETVSLMGYTDQATPGWAFIVKASLSWVQIA